MIRDTALPRYTHSCSVCLRTDDEQVEEDAQSARLFLLLCFDPRLNRQDGLDRGRGRGRRLGSGRGAAERFIAGCFRGVYSTGV